ncbi:GNAT family N-acetyltransferase [Frankia sp. CiP1_Cm_nod1]|uniref:GNAT family N-acetyltransferase n=1 Tax=Frankia sp. CiP1_Cm_nod1 TaxID=2897160 RepID=UPI0020256925
MPELRRPALLGRHHDRTQLDSGSPSLDDWLRRQASQSRRADTAATWVVADTDDRVVAYVAMSMSAVDVSRAPGALAARGLTQIPVLLCGRLAVDQRYTGHGLGRVLVRLLLTKTVDLNRTAACRAAVVHALDDRARAFWERFGFSPFSDTPDERDLYLLIKNTTTTLDGLHHNRDTPAAPPQ